MGVCCMKAGGLLRSMPWFICCDQPAKGPGAELGIPPCPTKCGTNEPWVRARLHTKNRAATTVGQSCFGSGHTSLSCGTARRLAQEAIMQQGIRSKWPSSPGSGGPPAPWQGQRPVLPSILRGRP